MRLSRSFLVLCALGLTPGLAMASDYFVDSTHVGAGTGTPGDPFPTIQAGIDAASNGDKIFCMPGTYVERIDFAGKLITVSGMAGRATTIIDTAGGGVGAKFVSGETTASTLEGFTIRNGFGEATSLANLGGGGVQVIDSGATLRDCLIEHCQAVLGGGLYVEDSDLVLEGVVVQQNLARRGETGFPQDGDGGGLFAVGDSNLTIRDSRFELNQAGGPGLHSIGRGGAIVATGVQLSLFGTRFQDNIALCSQVEGSAFGGAVVIDEGASATLYGCTFESNEAIAREARGGALFVDQADVDIEDVVFRENFVLDFVIEIDGEGGAMYAERDSNVVVRRSLFEGNEAALAGGAVYGGVSYEECTFRGNTGLQGGAGYVTLTPMVNPTYEACVFEQNLAFCFSPCQKDGGALWGETIVMDCLFVGNEAAGRGGAVWGGEISDSTFLANRTTSPPDETSNVEGGAAWGANLVRCTLAENEALGTALVGLAAEALGGGAAHSTLTYCELYDNQASHGGAVHNSDLDRCTLYGNQASVAGDGVHANVPTVIDSSILWSNGVEIADVGGVVSVSYSDVEGGWAGVGNIDMDPAFLSAFARDFHLRPGSPAIDAGNPAKLDPLGSRADMGAQPFERGYAPEPFPYCTAKPSSAGCLASMGWVGEPRLSGAGFALTADDVLGGTLGVLLWSLAPDNQPFSGGVLCLNSAVRTPPMLSGGSFGAMDCSGSLAFDFAPGYATAKGLQPYDEIFAQWLYRDPGYELGNSVDGSDALSFVMLP